jgi:hypothetical protein
MADSLSPITSCATTHGSGIRNRRRTQSSKARIFQLLISGSAEAFCLKRLDQNTEMSKGDARAAAAIAEILRDFLEAAVILETSNDRAQEGPSSFDSKLVHKALRSNKSCRTWPIPVRLLHPASDESPRTAPGSGTGEGLRAQKPDSSSF